MSEIKENISDKIRILKALEQDIRENKEIDVLKAYRQTYAKIRHQSRKALFFNVFNRVAAIMVIPLLVSTLIFMYLYLYKDSKSLQATTYTEIIAVPGSMIKTSLPDESEVWLNSGSTLRYPSCFSGEKRRVELSGEAFFDVKTNPEFPFEVEIPSGMKILAKGTSFNINAYANDHIREATLLHGKVDAIQNGRVIHLSPGEMASLDINSGQMWKTTVNLKEKTGWKEGLLIFRDTPLEEVFKRLSRHYNVEFNVQNKSSVSYRVRATFSTETITQILDVLKLAAPITWSVKKEMKQQSDLLFSRQHIDIVIN
jgi:ferric-dicitrate binding protein FerR (iron transport regulator)